MHLTLRLEATLHAAHFEIDAVRVREISGARYAGHLFAA